MPWPREYISLHHLWVLSSGPQARGGGLLRECGTIWNKVLADPVLNTSPEFIYLFLTTTPFHN